MANMIGTFFGKGCSADTIFNGSKIAANTEYKAHINQYNTIFIDFSEMPEDCNNYQQYIHRIRKKSKRRFMYCICQFKSGFSGCCLGFAAQNF